MNSDHVTIVPIVGKQNIGKTTLISALIPGLKSRGYRVGTLKYNIKEFEVDHKGKDTFKYSQSGADSLALSTNKKIAVIKKLANPLKLTDIIDTYLNDVNIVLVEGYRENTHPGITIIDSSETGTIGNDAENGLLLIREETEAKCFSTEDTDRALDFIENVLKSDKFK